ncbi:hypothetical protein E6O75_ATG02252 [Venturia nashicola]|uniref:Uncharacterized protein n=1 Tax=Venturia nashicola TaxID=86259 RepID=A0A4Z1P628_9PEZI|nr:hypothetical protein E6O75_ATG02252 [Venturia nashicola]
MRISLSRHDSQAVECSIFSTASASNPTKPNQMPIPDAITKSPMSVFNNTPFPFQLSVRKPVPHPASRRPTLKTFS